jgi:hypothetical protein
MIVAEQKSGISFQGMVRRDVDASIQFLQQRLKQIDEEIEPLIPSIRSGE